MKFSVWPSYDRSWGETLSLATWAEQSGFQSFWYADHLVSQVEDGESGDAHECWKVLLGWQPFEQRVHQNKRWNNRKSGTV